MLIDSKSYEAKKYTRFGKACRKLLMCDKDCGTITLHLHDYPGEYLLDIDLPDGSYDGWLAMSLIQSPVTCKDVVIKIGKRDAVVGEHSDESDARFTGQYIAMTTHRKELARR